MLVLVVLMATAGKFIGCAGKEGGREGRVKNLLHLTT